MRAIDAQNRLPEVATDQFALDRALKKMRKLRWIGADIDAEKILAILNEPPHATFKQSAPPRL
jgi:hypothetical protein